MVFVDESGFYLLPMVVRAYAPIGQTPILRHLLTYAHLSAISVITPKAKLYTMVKDRSIKGPDVVRFPKHPLQHTPGKLLIIWDGATIHCSGELRKAVARL